MPIEIKELVIRTEVSPQDVQGEGRNAPLDERALRPPPGPAAGIDTEQLVQECVRQVLRILERQRQR